MLLDKMQPEAIANYEDCINGLRPGYRDVGVRKMSHSWTANAIGICDICGADVELYDGYMGACQCPKCGQWYNMAGQQLVPPEQWEEPLEPEDYY